MLEVIGLLISYVCQLAIIMFVLKEFGIIKPRSDASAKDETSRSDKSTARERSAERPQQDFGSLMSGLMSQMMQGMPKLPEQPAIQVPAPTSMLSAKPEAWPESDSDDAGAAEETKIA